MLKLKCGKMADEILKKVRSLYEKYPYPSRNVTRKKGMETYANWVRNAIGLKNLDFFKGKYILEAGCGTGELGASLALCGANVVGIDLSMNSLKKAQELKKKFDIKNWNLIQSDVLDLALSKERAKFDIVISYGVLHHTSNPKKGFENLVLLVKDNGMISLGLYNRIGRARHRIKRKIVNIFAGENFEKRMDLARKLFFFGKMPMQGIIWLADKYAHPHESYHSVREVKGWFREKGIKFMSSKPGIGKIEELSELSWVLGRRGAFFVMTGLKE